MKKILLVLSCLFLLIPILSYSAESSSSNNSVGIGIILGEPTGLSIKYNNFPILGIAWSVQHHLSIHCDYWLVKKNLTGPLDWYLGAGGKIIFFNEDKNTSDSDVHSTIFGLRIPIGLQYFIIPKLELFAEIVPGMYLFPSTAAFINGGIGVRYYF